MMVLCLDYFFSNLEATNWSLKRFWLQIFKACSTLDKTLNETICVDGFKNKKKRVWGRNLEWKCKIARKLIFKKCFFHFKPMYAKLEISCSGGERAFPPPLSFFRHNFLSYGSFHAKIFLGTRNTLKKIWPIQNCTSATSRPHLPTLPNFFSWKTGILLIFNVIFSLKTHIYRGKQTNANFFCSKCNNHTKSYILMHLS